MNDLSSTYLISIVLEFLFCFIFVPQENIFQSVWEGEIKKSLFVPKNNLLDSIKWNFKMPIKAFKVHWDIRLLQASCINANMQNQLNKFEENSQITQTVFF